MKITNEFTERSITTENGRQIRGQRIVIEIDPEDDPYGDLTGLVVKERLEAWLRLYGDAHATPTDPAEAFYWLSKFGFAANVTEGRYDELLWACRDTLGMSWRSISRACELPVTTVRRRVAKLRDTYAREHGMFRDEQGLHTSTVADAVRRADALANGDRGEVESITVPGKSNVISTIIKVVGIDYTEGQ